MTDDTSAAALHGLVDALGEPAPAPWTGRRAVTDTDLPTATGWPGPLRVVLTGGAGQLTGPVEWCARHDVSLAALDTTLRDLDDPAGNARRVVAAAADLPEETALHVRVTGAPTGGWLRALDALAEAEAVVVLPLGAPTGGDGGGGGGGVVDPEPWIDAALDRELAVGLAGGRAEQALAALHATARLWGDPDDLGAARRWCRSWLVDDGAAAATDLHRLLTSSTP